VRHYTTNRIEGGIQFNCIRCEYGVTTLDFDARDGNPTTPGRFHYYFQAPAGASLAPHRHSVAMKITVRFGRKFILMGDLDNARVQRFDAGSTFTIPANTWHVEWWETETLEEVEGIGPMQTEHASPETPRQDAAGNRR